jgi:hypothetical protein
MSMGEADLIGGAFRSTMVDASETGVVPAEMEGVGVEGMEGIEGVEGVEGVEAEGVEGVEAVLSAEVVVVGVVSAGTVVAGVSLRLEVSTAAVFLMSKMMRVKSERNERVRK